MLAKRFAAIGFLIVCLCSLGPFVGGASADDDVEMFFENEIRPLLVERCQKCHGEKRQSNGLRVDSREGIVGGGDGGAGIIPGDADNSLLMRAVRYQHELQMPPKGKLSEQEIASIERWIEIGAPWPNDSQRPKTSDAGNKQHWAFQKLTRPDPPIAADDRWSRTPIDSFVMSRLREQGLRPSTPADRRTIIRRIHYTLTGLPPAPQDVNQFVADSDPRALEELVDRLLQSPAYGEHWSRHWLDIARYSDTKGYVYAREERHWVHAWNYRDWVSQAWNENMPYDRFLLLQLAADQVTDCRQSDLAAMGYLTLGRRFLGVNREIIDDRIDVTSRGMLGLTVSCARCHDHKYDPIPTADYYSLYGVFDSCGERLVALDDQAGSVEFRNELKKRQQTLSNKLAAARSESSDRARDRIIDYLRAQRELEKYPADGFDQIFQKSDLLPAFVRRWESYLYQANRQHHPVFIPWHAYADIPEEQFSQQAERVTRQWMESPKHRVNKIVADRFRTPPKSFEEVIERYGEIFAEMDESWQNLVNQSTDKGVDRPTQFADPAAEQLRQVLEGSDSPCIVPDEPIVHSEVYFDSATCADLWKAQGEVDRWIINSGDGAAYALTLTDRPRPAEPRIFRRGDPLKKGKSVPRHFLSVLSDENPGAFKIGSGRLELARAIIDPQNPLTARVIVNRIWTRHFGQGLVSTPSDFGTRAQRPSHPELLDYLASRLVADGWDLKKLHRMILLSSCYLQSSTRARDSELAEAMSLDPDNRLLWRMNPRRLSFEEFRDSLLSACDHLDHRWGGKPIALFDEPFPQRRTIYGKVDRQYLPGTLRVFDFANPDLHVPKRAQTTVPQQALFLMNHPVVLQRATALAKQVQRHSSSRAAIEAMFERTLQRAPTEHELADALRLVDSGQTTQDPVVAVTQADWQYGFGMLDETSERVTGFTPLPHFTGKAWQGGAKWPDAKLGWVQLTATGGHPGNDRQHAAIRRWTAPREMTIQIESQLIHQRPPGDGVRGFIVASDHGLLASAKVHQGTAALNVDTIRVSAGDTIDFLVDIGDVLNCDEHLWKTTIAEHEPTAVGATTWDSQSDFPEHQTRQMDPWEQLAQVLFCTNEFTFID